MKPWLTLLDGAAKGVSFNSDQHSTQLSRSESVSITDTDLGVNMECARHLVNSSWLDELETDCTMEAYGMSVE